MATDTDVTPCTTDSVLHTQGADWCATSESCDNMESERQGIVVVDDTVNSEAVCIYAENTGDNNENTDRNGNLVIAENPDQESTLLSHHFILDDNTDSILLPNTEVIEIKQDRVSEGIVLIGDQAFRIRDLLAAGSGGIAFPINAEPIFIEGRDVVDLQTCESQDMVIAPPATSIQVEKLAAQSSVKENITEHSYVSNMPLGISQPKVMMASPSCGIQSRAHKDLRGEYTESSTLDICLSNVKSVPFSTNQYNISVQNRASYEHAQPSSSKVILSSTHENHGLTIKEESGTTDSAVGPQTKSSPPKEQASTSRGKKSPRTQYVEKVYKCDLCSATFNRHGNFSRHRMVHTISIKDDFRYKCETCGKKFLQRCDLVRHMTIHSGTEAHRCEICHKGYIRASDLRIHMKFHLKQRSYKCSQCDKAFIQTGDLNRHVRTVHLKAKKLTCGHCYKKFTREVTLLRHMQTAHWQIIVETLGTLKGQSVVAESIEQPAVNPGTNEENI